MASVTQSVNDVDIDLIKRARVTDHPLQVIEFFRRRNQSRARIQRISESFLQLMTRAGRRATICHISITIVTLIDMFRLL
ncbi:MAG: hypothetical protein RIS22_675 [Actinomycetota bacterium]